MVSLIWTNTEPGTIGSMVLRMSQPKRRIVAVVVYSFTRDLRLVRQPERSFGTTHWPFWNAL